MRGGSTKENFKAGKEQYIPVWGEGGEMGILSNAPCFWGEDK